MAANIGEIRTKVQSRIKDTVTSLDVTPTTGDVDLAINAATEEYSKDKPLEKAFKVAGDGGFKYAISALVGFVDGFSAVRRVAYPYLTTDQVLSWLENDEFLIQRIDTGVFLWFESAKPAASEFFLAIFTAPHTLNASSSTIPATDDEAVSDLGAAFCLDKLAAMFIREIDATISADVVDRRQKSDLCRVAAKVFRSAYEAKMGGEEPSRPASYLTDVDGAFGNTARTDRFFHGRERF